MKYLALSFLMVSLGMFTIVGCSDNDNGGSGGIPDPFSCSDCFNDVPAGPSADAQACTDYGNAYGCTSAVLTNADQCGDPQATCEVRGCTSDPRPGCDSP